MKKILLLFTVTFIILNVKAKPLEVFTDLQYELNGAWDWRCTMLPNSPDFDASAYDYVWIEYDIEKNSLNDFNDAPDWDQSGEPIGKKAIRFGFRYNNYLGWDGANNDGTGGWSTWTEDYRYIDGEYGVQGIPIRKKGKIEYSLGESANPIEHPTIVHPKAGEDLNKHAVLVYFQPTEDFNKKLYIKGLYFGTEADFKAAKKEAGIGAKKSLQINELMQSNIDCVMDDLNDFPDSWVELYNTTTKTINLKGYQIGTKENASKAWALPNMTIEPNQYILIYCDKEGTDLHTDFRLESGKGCNVYLFKSSDIVDQVVDLGKQPAPNIAYGRKTEDSDDWGYQATPTPNTANCGQLCKKLLGEPIFSQKGMVMENGQSFKLTLTLPDDAPKGTVIRFTLDGSEPTSDSYTYTKPLNISGSRAIRAKLFCDGYLSPRSTSHSYIFFPRKVTLPVISIMTDDKYLNDSKIGIYADGDYQSDKKNYEFDWRRPINFEYFEGIQQESQLNQLCETRIAGGATRGNKLKTLAVYANKRFGTKRLEYEFFPDQKPGLTDFKSLMLRNAGNDFDYLYMRDAIIQRTMASHVDLDWQAWRPAIVYINGKYLGLLNIRERSNEDNIYTNYDGLEDIDMFENWWELKEGSWDNYNMFKDFYNEKGHTLAEFSEWMDWEEFLNLMIMNLYFNNQDFPGNNIVMWRPQAEGGKWRWVAKDTDFGLGLYNDWGGNNKYGPAFNSIKWINEPNYDPDRAWANQYDHTRLFRRLMDDEDFKREFIDRTCIYMGDFLNEKGIREVWDPMYDIIKYEYPYHREGINKWWPNYNEELENTRNWVANRTNEFYKQVGNYYKLGSLVGLTINKEKSDVEITFNGIKLSEGTFDGKFFANRTLTLSGKTSEDVELKGWKLTGGINQEVSGTELTLEMPSSAVTITPIIGNGTGIEKVKTTADKTTETFDLTGRKVDTPQKGQIYIQKGQKTIWR